MSESLYFVQLGIIGSILLMLTRRHWLMRLQILAWMLLNTGIVLRYGLREQRDFYSNDQGYHSDLIQRILRSEEHTSELQSH